MFTLEGNLSGILSFNFEQLINDYCLNSEMVIICLFVHKVTGDCLTY